MTRRATALSRLFFVLALGLSFLSFLDSRVDSWQELAALRIINFLVIGPLWAMAAILRFRGKMRVVMTVLMWVLLASLLSCFQSAITHARFTLSPQFVTSQVIRANAVQIQEYMKKHRQPPPGLNVLPERAGLITDAWGHDIQYSVDEKGVITIASFGADGKPGGEGRDADITERYRTRNADGTLNVDDEAWIGTARTDR
jgi:hypothetical protein